MATVSVLVCIYTYPPGAYILSVNVMVVDDKVSLHPSDHQNCTIVFSVQTAVKSTWFQFDAPLTCAGQLDNIKHAQIGQCCQSSPELFHGTLYSEHIGTISMATSV